MTYTITLKSQTINMIGTNFDVVCDLVLEVDDAGTIESIQALEIRDTTHQITLATDIGLDYDSYADQVDPDLISQALYEAKESMSDYYAEIESDLNREERTEILN